MLFRSDVPTGSMKPTIVEGDRIFINKMAYDLKVPFSQQTIVKFADPIRHDIVIFESAAANKRLVKRVIGVPGDVISMNKNQLVINQQHASYKVMAREKDFVLTEESVAGESRLIRTRIPVGQHNYSAMTSFKEFTVPEGFYLMMGDNRDNSADSRAIGLMPREEVIGRSNKVA